MSVVVHIDFPIWKVPRRVGIRPDRITDDLVVYINYWKNNGELEYRNPRFIKQEGRTAHQHGLSPTHGYTG